MPGEIGAAMAMFEEPRALGEPQKTVSTVVTTGDPTDVGAELSTHTLSDLMDANRTVKKTQLKAKTSGRSTPFQRVKLLLEQAQALRLQREAKNIAQKTTTCKAAPTLPQETTCKAAPAAPKETTCKAAPTLPKETTCKAAPTLPKKRTCKATTTLAEDMTCKAAPAEPLQEPTDANTSEPAHPHVPDLDKILPAKPKDWDIRDPVTAEQQQPAKKRGRKPKAKDTEPDGTHGKTEKQRSRK